MAFKSLRNIRFFFQWLGGLFRTWFTAYHYDDEEQEEKAAPAVAEKSPAPSNSAAEEQAAYESASGYDDSGVEPPYADATQLSEALAFRGPVGRNALSSILGRSLDEIDLEITQMAESGTVEELDDGRYLLNDSERRHFLRNDYRVSEWLSAFQNANFENEVLDVIEQLCRQLPVKISPGKGLAIHVRQQKWMIWQSRPEHCRVKLYGTLTREQWLHLREIDKRVRRFRIKQPHRWDSRDSASFRWRLGADTLAIESIMIESGREFQKRVRRRRRPARDGREAASANSSPS